MDIAYDCPECGKTVRDYDDAMDGEEVLLSCKCGCEFAVEADVSFHLMYIENPGRIGQEKLGDIENEKYLDKLTPSLFPGVPPLRDLLKEKPCPANP
jgi:hypothetical protein